MWTVVKREYENLFVQKRDGSSRETYMGYSDAAYGASGTIEGIDVNWDEGHLVLGHGNFWEKDVYKTIDDVPAEKRYLFELLPCYWEDRRIPLPA